jgi:hypothetical protein
MSNLEWTNKYLSSDVKPKKRYSKPYDSKKAWDFYNRFAIDQQWHGMKMTSHGCFQRHNKTRQEMDNTPQENKKRNLENISREEWSEMRMVSDMARFIDMGYIVGNEHPDEFVQRCKEEEGEECI